MSQDCDLRSASRAFIAAAFDVLTEERVIPTSAFNPYVAVGRDYFGDSVRGLPEFNALEAELNDAYPKRFGEPLARRNIEFPSTYVFGFLEACIARCGRDNSFNPDSSGVDESIDELLSVLDAAAYDVVCCRQVSHLTTTNGAEATIGDVTVVPDSGEFGDPLLDRVQREIRGAARAWDPDDAGGWDPPHSLLVIRTIADDPEPYDVAERLSRRLERFLLLARLLTAGTVQSGYEISGPTTLVARLNPVMTSFRKGWLGVRVRRTVRLTGDEGPAFAALGSLIEAADVRREGMVVASFDVALRKYNQSYSSDGSYAHLVDLATALEAALIGANDSGELTLRLRSRVAALLVTDDDPASALFEDVNQLYRLRSKLVHGGHIKRSDLRKALGRISTVPDASADHFGVALGHAVDRMRDLVRRAILARLCLAAEPGPLWPLEGDTSVDAILSDDKQRAEWRARWQERLTALGVERAARPPRAAVDFLSTEDR